MKTSPTVAFTAGLLLFGGTEGFSGAAKHLISRSAAVGPNRKSRVFQQAIDNPKQELLNNRHSASDWLYNVRSLPQSVVLREIRNPVMAAFGWACLVSFVHKFFLQSKFSALQRLATQIAIPTAAHSFLVSSLGLLLVFRTNSAYQRFNVSRPRFSVVQARRKKILNESSRTIF